MGYRNLYISAFIFVSVITFAGCTDNVSNSSSQEESPPPEGAEPPAQEMGINVNGQYNLMKFENIDRSGTTWVRGFLDFFQLYPDSQNLDSDPRVQNYLKLKEQGYKNILNIKWDFSNRSFPDSASQKMQDYKSYLNRLLDKVWPATDIIVIGNEPFIDSKRSERGPRLVSFYRQIAREIKTYRENSDKDVPIFVGAFNNLYLDGWRTQPTNQLLSFANSKSWVAGIDIHIHHSGINQIDDFMDYVNVRIRENQKILISEFSIKDHFRSKMEENIPAGFAAEYGYNPDMQNYQYLDSVLKESVPRQEWINFLSSSYWFENRKRYLKNAFERFKSYEKFHIANYALRQSYPFNQDFTANTTPWILNGLFANRTVRPDTTTEQDQFNYAWIEDFSDIQENAAN